MATVKPFRAWRPSKENAIHTAALPYDVYNRAEARAKAQEDALSFLNIDRPETQFPEDADMYAEAVYEKANEMLRTQMAEGIYIQDEKPCYYLYELTMNGNSQTGLVAAASVDDYINGVIKRHENTRAEKEKDRINHVDHCSMQTGPIFLAYHASEEVGAIVAKIKTTEAMYDLVSDDGIGHRAWIIDDDADIQAMTEAFAKLPALYIADGHHRAASAVKVGLKRREAHPDYTGAEEFNSFLSVIFPDNELNILPYYRVVKDLNGYTAASLIEAMSKYFEITEENKAVDPEKYYEYGCYIDEKWYKMELRPEYIPDGPVERLDVSVLQNLVLEPMLGIADPKTDARIDFVGGIRGVKELEKRCHEDMKIAFSLYATKITQLFDVADAGMLMPPKSTWFEPKLRSGLFFHEIER